MSDELRDYPDVLRFIRGVGYDVHAEHLSTVEKVAENHALTEEEAAVALIDLGLIFLANYPREAHLCLVGLSILRQGEPGDLK